MGRRYHKYGAAHQAGKRLAMARLVDGQPCARCESKGIYHPLDRSMTSAELHYDHRDDGRGYLGLSGARCNLADGGRKGRASQMAARGQEPKVKMITCCVCGLAFERRKSETVCCGRPSCVTEVKRIRREGVAAPAPPVASGRVW